MNNSDIGYHDDSLEGEIPAASTFNTLAKRLGLTVIEGHPMVLATQLTAAVIDESKKANGPQMVSDVLESMPGILDTMPDAWKAAVDADNELFTLVMGVATGLVLALATEKRP